MKNKYYYLLALAKDNIFYLISFFTLILAFIFSVFFYINKSVENKSQIKTIFAEIEDLNSKKELIVLRGKLKNEGLDIDEINKLFYKLVPEEEDFFSIISALEKISIETGFFITEYELNLSASSAKKISLNVYGIGNNNVFMSFLKEYNFGGGRLITINEISFSSQSVKGNKLTLTFYSGKAPESTAKIIVNNQDKQFLKEIKNKITVNYAFTPEADLSYPTKTNPF